MKRKVECTALKTLKRTRVNFSSDMCMCQLFTNLFSIFPVLLVLQQQEDGKLPIL